ncbi:MAG TPA: D-aminopeptidase [Caulobacteraceae bacterium]|nr:D-aminopeptidase [Caulobacteraceae bacterium]
MAGTLTDRLDRAVAALARDYPGPGGSVAVLREGEVLARHAWGWANAERRIPFTPKSLFRMCSITKQFTVRLVLDAFADPSELDPDVAAMLPNLEATAPRALHLAHNQSGLRDYWAVAMLHGSPAEAPFGDAEAARVIAGTRSLQFAPGTRFSYVNQNFRILCDIVQARTGRGFGELLKRRIFDRVGMESAILAADTRAMTDGTEGYEGSAAAGFRPAENRILWTGDAGLGASLDDMIAWERHIDATRDDPTSLYQRQAAPVAFADGAPAPYGFGLARSRELGRPLTSHGGGLRGWRSHRLYSRQDRVSVVVMFNHLANAHAAAIDVLAAVLDVERPKPASDLPAPGWLGAYLEPETGLSVRVEAAPKGQVSLRYGSMPSMLDLRDDGSAGDAEGERLRPGEGGLWFDASDDNQSTRLQLLAREAARDIAGRYRCAELDAELTIEDAGGAPYGAFSGFLGQGRMDQLAPVGGDVWALPCLRSLDYTPPGDWTLAFQRDGAGPPARVQVGCWLARRLTYERIG